MNRSVNILRQITDIDHPADNSQSFVFSQPSIVLNKIEVISIQNWIEYEYLNYM